ncbi:Transport protein particle subunit [Lachnellula hyalina]|uniref:Transport protein particle subunit n=1 Tax=Lachnellula hyalina TaxID=1316788 RepID=A0A8H8U0N0_9HELO|nr:Transport protein particle subunit [Lachnellula hyalina]TVY27067.1 Transport protein particle subunit [Lachnellula hyalina]
MLDQLSPVAPARVRVVLLPIGQIKRARFLNFVERLQPENVVRLGDISPDGRPHRNMFSPLAFPTGMIVYDLTTFYPPSSHVALSPFELYREPLVFIAIGDGAELDHVAYRNPRRSLNGSGPPRPEHNLRELYQDLEDVRDRYPKGLVHQLLLFDYVHPTSAGPLPEGLVAVPPPAQCTITTLKTIMCDISSLLLAEMTTLAKSLQALNTIESPSQSQGSRQHNETRQADLLSRRNSHISSAAQNSRSDSPGDSHDRNHVRMSMPVLRSTDSNTSSSSGRPTTPQNGAQTDLPTSFDQIVGRNKSDSTPSQRPISSRLTSTEPVRDISRDRVSVQGFGPGSISERSRNIGKGRIGVVVGSLYLQAGRWGDALRELTEAGAIAKYNLDHLWHAKSLDYILVSMLMLAWTGLDFQIPQICYITEKALQASSSGEPKSPASNRLVSLQNLVVLLPELLDRILNLYARAANNTGEALPQFPFSESVVRFSKLLSVIHLAGGELDDDVLQLLVVSTPFKKRPNVVSPRVSIRPTRTEIVATLFRAFPSKELPEYLLSVVDRTIVLSGIASTLGLLGYYRKKAMVMRELVKVLIPGLVQARIKGAAEMGVHPAAGLAALNSINGSTHGAGALDLGEGDVENGVDSFLGLLGQTYGVVSSVDNFGETELHDDSNEAAIARIVKNATLRAFGGQGLKMDVLRSCINFSEALPDFHGVLRFTADLLRTAGSGVAPGPRSDDASPSMTREEQVRLATNITRTLGAARSLGVKNIAAEYWDEFLVRGVELEALPVARTPIPHKKDELPGTTAVASSRGVNPFIYNPFLRAPDTTAVDRLLVAGEGAIFRVTLQNPYEFDVEIESMKLESEGVIFASSVQKTVIGPYRTQILSVSGTPKGAGHLKITGCIVRVRGCRERRFPIFEDPWSPQSAVKVKTIGVAAIFKPKDRPTSTDSRSTISPSMTPPKTTSIGLNVIERQPVVIVKSNTLSQSAVMVLEGERQRFSVTLENLSKDTPVDLLLFTFKDSTQAPLQTAISNRDASPAELYEYELIFARKQALRWIPKAGEKPHIEPSSTSTFEMEILGKPGLTSAMVQVDYAYLGVPPTEVQDDFHTRQVSLPLTITVNASVELARMDILPLTGTIPRSIWTDMQRSKDTKKDITPEDYCLLLLDLRNAWPSHLHVHLEVSDEGMIDEEILPGNTSRIMFPIPRIFLDDPHAGIPALDPSRQRQFVVSAGPVSAESERSSREAFWYREQILKMLHGTWHTKSGPSRNGEIELRGIRLSQRMIEAVKIEEIGIELMVNGATSQKPRHEVFTNSFAEFKVRISNRTTTPIFPMLRVQPSLRNQAHNISLDLSRKLIWNGILQQALPEIAGKESVEIGIGMTALCRGEFEISASVEEARLKELPLEEGKGSVTRPRANTRAMMDALLGAKERRMWHSREPCLVVVRDEDSSDDDDNE